MTTAEQTHQGLELYPWLTTIFEDFVSKGVPNSLLIHGEKDIGKLNFALYLANYLICESPSNRGPCFNCPACHWYKKANHPDFFAILPEDAYHLLPFEVDESVAKSASEDKKLSKSIKIDQVRDILAVNTLGSYRGGKRVVLIYPIEAMGVEAANCLLKTLEEPSQDLMYILVSHRLDNILPTIRSRCRLLGIPKPSSKDVIPWILQKTSGENTRTQKFSEKQLEALFIELGRSPLKVLPFLQGVSFNSQLMLSELSKGRALDHGKLVDLLGSSQLADLLGCLQKWCIDLYMVYSGLSPRYYPQSAEVLQKRVQSVDINGLNLFLKTLIQEIKLTSHPLFPKIQLESILTKYTQIFRN